MVWGWFKHCSEVLGLSSSLRGWILPERAGRAPHCRCDPVSCPVLGCGSARAGGVPALCLLSVLSTGWGQGSPDRDRHPPSGWGGSGKAGSRSPCCTRCVGPSQPSPASVSLLQCKQSIPLLLQGSPCCLLPRMFQLLSQGAAMGIPVQSGGEGRVISSPHPFG